MTRHESITVANRYVGALYQSGVGPKGLIWAFKISDTKPPHAATLVSKGGYHATQKERTRRRDELARYFREG